jgi:Reverse transcriptase (RNA-dependent DNA polymerase)
VFAREGKVLKIRESLYGLKQAPLTLLLHLEANLEGAGFRQSQIIPYSFISDTVTCLFYVGIMLFFSPNQEYIEMALEKRKKVMEIDVEDDVAGFLGVHIKRSNDVTIRLTQTGMIERCIYALCIEGIPAKHTLAKYGCLGAHHGGKPEQDT